jgi:hypothetical protein
LYMGALVWQIYPAHCIALYIENYQAKYYCA